jgi:hypothetical protein
MRGGTLFAMVSETRVAPEDLHATHEKLRKDLAG